MRIGIDFDGVIADTPKLISAWLDEHLQIKISPAETYDRKKLIWLFDRRFGYLSKIEYSEFLYVILIPGEDIRKYQVSHACSGL